MDLLESSTDPDDCLDGPFEESKRGTSLVIWCFRKVSSTCLFSQLESFSAHIESPNWPHGALRPRHSCARPINRSSPPLTQLWRASQSPLYPPTKQPGSRRLLVPAALDPAIAPRIRALAPGSSYQDAIEKGVFW